MKMIVHNGKRYRPEDAKRLGIVKDDPPKNAAKKKAAKNKARTVEDEGTGGPA